MGAIVQMPEGRVCVNELQREARQKLFSYAVAALSDFRRNFEFRHYSGSNKVQHTFIVWG
jgi:hypothetical protein